jgi:hypothetical protein
MSLNMPLVLIDITHEAYVDKPNADTCNTWPWGEQRIPNRREYSIERGI